MKRAKVEVSHLSPSEDNKPSGCQSMSASAKAEGGLDLNMEPPTEQEFRESGDSEVPHVGKVGAPEVKVLDPVAAPLNACLAYDSEDNYDDD